MYIYHFSNRNSSQHPMSPQPKKGYIFPPINSLGNQFPNQTSFISTNSRIFIMQLGPKNCTTFSSDFPLKSRQEWHKYKNPKHFPVLSSCLDTNKEGL